MRKRWIIGAATAIAVLGATAGISYGVSGSALPFVSGPPNPHPPHVTMPTPHPWTQADTQALTSKAEQWLTADHVSATIKGQPVPLGGLASFMAGIAENHEIAALAAKGTFVTDLLSVIPAPGETEATDALADVVLNQALYDAAGPAGVSVPESQVQADAAQGKSMGLPGAGSPGYADFGRRVLVTDAMRKYVLATTAGSSDAQKLANWLAPRLASYDVTAQGIPVPSSGNLATELS